MSVILLVIYKELEEAEDFKLLLDKIVKKLISHQQEEDHKEYMLVLTIVINHKINS